MTALDDGLKVLVVGINYAPEPTGIAPYTSRMAAGLRARGHRVRVLTAYPHYPQWRVPPGWTGATRREEVDGVQLTRLRHYVPARPAGLRRALSEVSFGARTAVRRLGSPDVVVCVSPALISSVMLREVQRRTSASAAFGLVIQDIYSKGLAETGSDGLGSRLIRGLESRLARGADGVAVIHDRFRDSLGADLGVAPEAVTVIRNWTHTAPVDDFDRAAYRRSRGWAEDETVVLHAGAMGVKQGLANVVEAARVADADGSRVRFVLMGDGGQRPALEEQAAGVRALEFVDPQPDEDFGRMLRSADLLLVNELVGIAEMAVPSKLTSYFQAAVPVVAAVSPDGTTAAEVEAAGAGVVVGAGDPAALLGAVEKLAGDRELMARLGAAGPSYCRSVLGEQAALDAYDAWVRRLATGRRAARSR